MPKLAIFGLQNARAKVCQIDFENVDEIQNHRGLTIVNKVNK